MTEQPPSPSPRHSGRTLVMAVASFLVLAVGTLTVGLYYALAGRSAVPRAPVELVEQEDGPPALAQTLGEEGTLRIDVLSLERLSSGMVELRLAVTHVGAAPTPLDIAQRFSVDDPDRGTLAEVYLADLGHQRKFFVLRDADGEPIGSRDSEPLRPLERRILWARFPAPPDSEREVVVHVPHADPMPNVPVQDLVADEPGTDEPEPTPPG